jgi:hypothetical protein
MAKPITRREFIKGSAGVVIGSAVAGLSAQTAKKSRVVLIRHPDAVEAGSRFNAPIIQQMLDEAIVVLLDARDPAEAFGWLIKPGETVGIKTNVWSYLPTPAEVEQHLKRRVMEAGVKESDIGIDDHNVKQNPIFQKATSLINVRPIRTHYLAGMSGCIKNYIMFAPSQPALHPNSCADLGSNFSLPQVKGKTRLNILCCLTPQFHGRGPHHFSRRYVWNYNGILMSQDPVSVDTIGLELIKAKRRQVLGKAKELPPVPKHIKLADTKHGIGVGDLDRIELIKLGWQQDILI